MLASLKTNDIRWRIWDYAVYIFWGSGGGPENSRGRPTGLRADRCAPLMGPALGDLSRMNAQKLSVPSHFPQIQDRCADSGGRCGGGNADA